MKPGATVIYESTVYPGATEEICIPVLEKHSGMRWRQDFTVGYSPERINPGGKQHTLTKILKVVSGDSAETLDKVAALYESIITAGVHRASSIKVAEAAKVIENTQRDLNIALMNELAIIFDKLGIDTSEVLEAAGTKWNFLKFKPGLVGGHCIGVAPYYLTHKAEMLGYHPQVILAGRRINDGMGEYVARQVLRLMLKKQRNPVGARALVLGLTFKENCPDLRNSRVIDVIAGSPTSALPWMCMTRWPIRKKRGTNMASRSYPSRNRRPTMPSCSPWRTRPIGRWAPRASAPTSSPAACSTTSNPCCRARVWRAGCRNLNGSFPEKP
jgi:UDP-N-acetyl-D-galactosamine dehydrogenase